MSLRSSPQRTRGTAAVGALALLSFLAVPIVATAAPTGNERRLTPEEIRGFLESRGLSPADRASDEDAEAPPSPPPYRGLVLESTLGALTQLGTLGKVTPPAPWVRLQVGYEVLSFLMVYAAGDGAIANTGLGNPPPGPRGYALFAFTPGLRATLRPLRVLGLFLQGELGFGAVNEDVLATYGFRDSTSLNLLYGGALGLEWYQVSPHLALGVVGGVRMAPGLARERDSAPPLSLNAALSLRYAFGI